MNLELDNKIILVAGGARGIGASVVAALAAEGAVPFIFDRASPSQELLSRTGAPVLILDLGDPGACEAAIQQVATRFGRIDGLVNGAAEDIEVKESDPLFVSMTRSLAHYHLMTHHCVPHLRRARGAIVSIANQAAMKPQEPCGYVAVKTGVLELTREWSAALAGDGVRVNAVVPARTPAPSPPARVPIRRAVRRVPPRPAPAPTEVNPREVADMVLFLLSPRAGLTTGQWLCVDGAYAGPGPIFA